jgi:hypothetical protein
MVRNSLSGSSVQPRSDSATLDMENSGGDGKYIFISFMNNLWTL